MRSIILDDLKYSPFSLVTFAYQAGLCSQGIPGWKSLITAHQHQQISSLDLVQEAVEANLLPSQLLANQEYLSAVDNSLYLYYLKQPESETVSLTGKIWTKLSPLAEQIPNFPQAVNLSFHSLSSIQPKMARRSGIFTTSDSTQVLR